MSPRLLVTRLLPLSSLQLIPHLHQTLVRSLASTLLQLATTCSMLSASPLGAARRVKAVVALLVNFLLHCSWVLLNGSTVLGRLWSVAGEPQLPSPALQAPFECGATSNLS